MKEDRRVVVKFWLSFLYRQALSEVAAKLTRIEKRVLNDLQRTRRLVIWLLPHPLSRRQQTVSLFQSSIMCVASRAY
jgi:hypothetical protein